MLVRALLSVTLFTSLLGAAQPSDSNIFRLRSFLHPKTTEKIPFPDLFNGKLEPKLLAVAPAVKAKNDKCAIPLLELKANNKIDSMAFATHTTPIDQAAVIAPTLPACAGWVQGQNQQSAPGILRWH